MKTLKRILCAALAAATMFTSAAPAYAEETEPTAEIEIEIPEENKENETAVETQECEHNYVLDHYLYAPDSESAFDELGTDITLKITNNAVSEVWICTNCGSQIEKEHVHSVYYTSPGYMYNENGDCYNHCIEHCNSGCGYERDKCYLFHITGKVLSVSTADGSVTRECTGCGKILVRNSFGDFAQTYPRMKNCTLTVEETVEETCTAYGYTIQKCSDCGWEYVSVTEPAGHDYQEQKCDGYSVFTCSKCGDSYTRSHTFDEGTITVQPTCQQEGKMTYTCTECGETKTEDIPKSQHSYTETVVPASYNTTGYTAHVCSVCGDTYRDNETAVLTCTHEYDAGTVTKEATCDAEGEMTYQCVNCGATKTEAIPQLEHVYTYTTCHLKSATLVIRICTLCERKDIVSSTKNTTTPAATATPTASTEEHTHTMKSVYIDPTCTTQGYTVNYCTTSGCGYKEYSYDENAPALGHNWVKTGTVVAATETSEGYTVYQCSNCGGTTHMDTTPKLPVQTDTVTADEMAEQIIELVNEERAKVGLPALAADDDLMATANIRARECSTYFSHTRPDGTSCFTAFSGKYTTIGENIAYGYDSAEAFMDAWMNSEYHRANILDSSFTHIGVSVYISDLGGYYAVQNFGG